MTTEAIPFARGVDLHPRNQRPVDWDLLATQVRFVIVKFTEGRALLPWQADGVNDSHVYVAASRGVGLLTGTYHVAHCENNAPDVEAMFYAAQLDEAGWMPGRDLPPVLDIEPRLFTIHHLDGAMVTDWCLKFCGWIDGYYGLTDPDQRCGLYAGQSIFGRFDYKAVVADRWFWWGGYPATGWPDTLPPGADIYQAGDSPMLVDGVGGSTIDLNVATPATLQALAPDHTGGDVIIGLTFGNTGNAVRELQSQLVMAGFYTGQVDGIYGPDTSAAVLACRKAQGSNATSGDTIDHFAYRQILTAVIRAKGTPGPKGDPGPPGPKGDQGQAGKTPTKVTVHLPAADVSGDVTAAS